MTPRTLEFLSYMELFPIAISNAIDGFTPHDVAMAVREIKGELSIPPDEKLI